ncbi:hypothetical protein CDAR_273611 [Caerostris darwini]|uniref:Uncharacterized protein n=1 Tax=Caerostris darwini TaxID=1538125 RepID=A0AAV4S9R3_9ARAC|nr:hypothetical protein CDAR_273611 [Caerostris darwini]
MREIVAPYNCRPPLFPFRLRPPPNGNRIHGCCLAESIETSRLPWASAKDNFVSCHAGSQRSLMGRIFIRHTADKSFFGKKVHSLRTTTAENKKNKKTGPIAGSSKSVELVDKKIY